MCTTLPPGVSSMVCSLSPGPWGLLCTGRAAGRGGVWQPKKLCPAQIFTSGTFPMGTEVGSL